MPDEADLAPAEAADGFAPIALVYSLPEASVLLATLHAYGIAALAHSQGTVSVLPTHAVALGGIGIMVAPAQLEDALALLETIDGGWIAPPPAYADEAWVNGGLSIGLFALGGVVPMPRTRGVYRWRCAAGQARSSAL